MLKCELLIYNKDTTLLNQQLLAHRRHCRCPVLLASLKDLLSLQVKSVLSSWGFSFLEILHVQKYSKQVNEKVGVRTVRAYIYSDEGFLSFLQGLMGQKQS